MIDLLWKSTLVLSLALTAVHFAPRARASVRHAILIAALVILAALPLTTALAPRIPVAALPPMFASLAPADAALRNPRTASARALDVRGNTANEPRASTTSAAAAPEAPSSLAGRAATRLGVSPAVAIVAGVWMLGLTLSLASLCIGVWHAQRLRRSAIPSVSLQPLLRALAGTAGVRTHVDLVTHEQVTAPITFGVHRPTILLPSDAPAWSASNLSRALVHELEHVKRRDWATQVFARAVCALYWFHPLVWIASRQLSLEAEHACDDAVVAREDHTLYADQLVTLARRMAARPAVAVLGMAQRSDLAARVHAVLDESKPRGRAGLWRTMVIATLAVASVAALAPIRLAAARDGAQVSALDAAQRTPVLDANSPRDAAGTIREDAASPRLDADSPRQDPNSPRVLEQQTRSSRLDRTLVEAAADGELDDVRELIDAGANVNAAVVGDGSPLIVAAREGYVDIVRFLLERGADVNLSVPGDGAPLSMAAREGHLGIAQLLLDRGADIDQMTPGDENALIQASAEGHLEMVKLLVARGAHVNARIWVENTRRGGEWRSPLTMATNGGHREVVAFLLSAGAVE